MGRHRWVELLEVTEDGNKTLKILLKVTNRLKNASKWDRKDPDDYPINTYWALAEIENSLSKQLLVKGSLRYYKNARKPRRLADLVEDGAIASVWEDQNSGTFADALRQAAVIDDDNAKQCWKVFQSIIRAMESAYLSEFLGWEFLRKPRVNILHTGLNRIAIAGGLKDQTRQGFAEFLDDLCPCGIKDHSGAVRQLSRRSTTFSRPK